MASGSRRRSAPVPFARVPFFGGRPRRVRPHPTPRRCAEPPKARASATRPRAGPARRICRASLAVPRDDLGMHARCGRFFRCSPDALLPTNRSPAAHRLRSPFRSFRVLRIRARRSSFVSMPPSKRKAANKTNVSSARHVVAARGRPAPPPAPAQIQPAATSQERRERASAARMQRRQASGLPREQRNRSDASRLANAQGQRERHVRETLSASLALVAGSPETGTSHYS